MIILINDIMYLPVGEKSVTSFHLSGLTFLYQHTEATQNYFQR